MEQWRPWPQDDRYEVSDQGRVRSWAVRGSSKLRRDQPQVLSPFQDQDGYLRFSMQKKTFAVSSMVLETWVGPRPEPGHQARHLNDVPYDNRLSNLAWGTRAENEQDRKRNRRCACSLVQRIEKMVGPFPEW